MFFEPEVIDGFDYLKYLVDIPTYKAQHELLNNLDIDPSAFTKDALAQRPGMEWLNTVDTILLSPPSADIESQKNKLNDLIDKLKQEAVLIEHEFCPVNLPVDFKKPVIALDTETSGLDLRLRYDYNGDQIVRTKLVGISFAISDICGFYIPVLHNELDGNKNWSMEAALFFLDRLHREFLIVYHNCQYDREVLAFNGVKELQPFPNFFDTLTIHFFNDVNLKTHGLKAVSEKILGRKMIEIETLFTDLSIINSKQIREIPVINFNRIPVSVGYVYACVTENMEVEVEIEGSEEILNKL